VTGIVDGSCREVDNEVECLLTCFLGTQKHLYNSTVIMFEKPFPQILFFQDSLRLMRSNLLMVFSYCR